MHSDKVRDPTAITSHIPRPARNTDAGLREFKIGSIPVRDKAAGGPVMKSGHAQRRRRTPGAWVALCAGFLTAVTAQANIRFDCGTAVAGKPLHCRGNAAGACDRGICCSGAPQREKQCGATCYGCCIYPSSKPMEASESPPDRISHDRAAAFCARQLLAGAGRSTAVSAVHHDVAPCPPVPLPHLRL